MLVRKQVQSSRKDGLSQNLLFETKGPYRVIEKNTLGSYWNKRFHFCKGLGRPGRKVNKWETRMEKIPYTMVIHKHMDGVDTRFSTMAGPLANNNLGKWLGLIRRGT